MAQQQTSKKDCAKRGRNKARCDAYKKTGRREINKLKRVLQSNGAKAALAWAAKNECLSILRNLAKRDNRAVRRAILNPEFAKFVGR